MRSIVVVSLFLGIIMITIGYINQVKKCPPPETEIRYVPRTFREEQEDPVKPSELFYDMFEKPNPWVAGFDLSSRPQSNREINRYFISQS